MRPVSAMKRKSAKRYPMSYMRMLIVLVPSARDFCYVPSCLVLVFEGEGSRGMRAMSLR